MSVFHILVFKYFWCAWLSVTSLLSNTPCIMPGSDEACNCQRGNGVLVRSTRVHKQAASRVLLLAPLLVGIVTIQIRMANMGNSWQQFSGGL